MAHPLTISFLFLQPLQALFFRQPIIFSRFAIEVGINVFRISVVVSECRVDLRKRQTGLAGDVFWVHPSLYQPATLITVMPVPATRGRPPRMSGELIIIAPMSTSAATVYLRVLEALV